MRLKGLIKKEDGAVLVVESAIVFPVVFFVIIILLYMGNLFYQQAKVDAITVNTAQYLAAVYTDPVLKEMVFNDGAIPTNSTKMSNIQPYRYLLGDSQSEKLAKAYLEGSLKNVGTGLYSGMEIDAQIKSCKIENYVIYQKAVVEIEYKLDFYPLRLFALPTITRVSTADATSAADPAEFVRNVDMIMDYSEEFGLTDKIKSVVGKFK